MQWYSGIAVQRNNGATEQRCNGTTGQRYLRQIQYYALLKSMTCRQLGGACDEVFSAETFEEIAELSKQHGRAMFQAQDAPHLAAMEKMKEMKSPEAMQDWFMARKAEFDALPKD